MRSKIAAAWLLINLTCNVAVAANAAKEFTADNIDRCAAGAADAATCDSDKRGAIHIPAGRYFSFFKRKDGGSQDIPVAAFWLDIKPVTRADYLDFVRRRPAWRKSQIKALFAENNYLADWADDLNPGEDTQAAVMFVSWFAARAYCTDRGGRLPTVAEWERVAGAVDNTKVGAPDTAIANPQSPFRFAMGQSAADVRSTPLTFGSAWEWTVDFNSALALGATSGAVNNSGSSLFCGDGFRSNNATDYAAFLRYSFRSSLRANYTLKNLGFRCAR
ncbi:MAG TPA: formylglycine-generating enzyme family protein [Spongiibacteraceae bacterium]